MPKKPKTPVVIDKESLEDYETLSPTSRQSTDFTGYEPEGTKGEALIWAKVKGTDGTEPSYVIKKLPKVDGKSSPYYTTEKWLLQYAPVKASCLVTAASLFEDADASYVVYPIIGARHFGKWGISASDLEKKYIAFQYMGFLRSLHKQGVLYLKAWPDNAFLTESKKLVLLGFDTGAILPGGQYDPTAEGNRAVKDAPPNVSPSLIVQWSPDVLLAGLDWQSLGLFICRLGSSTRPFTPEGLLDLSKLGSNYESALVNRLMDKAIALIPEFDPQAEEFMIPELKVEYTATRFTANSFHVDWYDGIAIGYEDTEIGIRASNGEIFLKGARSELSLNPDRLELKDKTSWWYSRLTLDESGIKLDRGYSHMHLTDDGFKWTVHWDSYVHLGPDGLLFRKSWPEPAELRINDSGLNADFKGDDLKKDFKDGGILLTAKPRGQTVSLGTKGLKLETKNHVFKLSLGGLKMHAGSLDFNFTVGSDPTIFMKAGGATLTISSKGLDIAVDDATFHADTSGVTFSASGFTFTLGADGASVESDNPAFDLSQYEIRPKRIDFSAPRIRLPKLPPLPKIPLPSLPGSVPSLGSGGAPSLSKPSLSMPSMPKMASLPKLPAFGGKERVGKIEDWLNDGETVKDQVDVIKRRKLVLKKTVHLVRTSTDRLFYCSKLYGEKLGDDIVLAKSSTVTPVKAVILKVTNAAGKELSITFQDGGARDTWKGKFQEIIDALPA